MAATAPSPSGTQVGERFLASLVQIAGGERVQRCLQCGACSGVCPYGYVMHFPPSRLITVLRAEEFDQVLQNDTVWLCISCFACTQVCPVRIPLTSAVMTRAKEEAVLMGNVPTELSQALENSQRYGNVLGQSPRKRADWAKDVVPPVPIFGKEKKSAGLLWYVGDYGSYHPRLQAVSRALARVLHAIGVDFAILGPDEVSDGDSQRLAGERGLFEMLAAKNGQAFHRYAFEAILTTDPHAYNALRNEYPRLGVSYPVWHYTTYLSLRLDDLRPLLRRELSAKVAYHDPCYLGRANGIYDEPRELLRAIPGLELVEMPHTRSTSICCGGGGGGMWLDGFQWEKTHARTSEWRVQEAAMVGAQVLAVACPYEPLRFEDAVKVVGQAAGIVVRDIAELLADALGDRSEG